MATYTDPDALDQLAEHIKLRRPNEVIGTDVAFGELTVTATASGILDLLDFLRSDSSCRFSTLVDITAVDYPSRQQRFDVVWHFLSMYQNHRIRVKVAIREDEMLPTLTAIYPAAQLVRARDLRHVRDPVHRSSGPAPHPDRLWLFRPSAAQGLSDHRLCRGSI